MLYNQTNQMNGMPMPLLMGYTNPTPIQEEENEKEMIYDPVSQKTEFDMRILGTKCLRTSSTRKGTRLVPDQKNVIDDQKSVK